MTLISDADHDLVKSKPPPLSLPHTRTLPPVSLPIVPQVSVSTVIVALYCLLEETLQGGGSGRSRLYTETLEALLPWALHTRHAVRVPVQVWGWVRGWARAGPLGGSLNGIGVRILSAGQSLWGSAGPTAQFSYPSVALARRCSCTRCWEA